MRKVFCALDNFLGVNMSSTLNPKVAARCNACQRSFQANPNGLSKVEVCGHCSAVVHPKCLTKEGYWGCCDDRRITSVTCHVAARAFLSTDDISVTLLSTSQELATVAAAQRTVSFDSTLMDCSASLPDPPAASKADSVTMTTAPNVLSKPTFVYSRPAVTAAAGSPRHSEVGVSLSVDENAPVAAPNYSDVVRDKLAGIPRTAKDPMSILADAMCTMSEGIQRAVANTETMSADIVSLKKGQVNLEARVSNLESDGGSSALDLGSAALSRAQDCEPYVLVFSDVPVHPDSLTADLLVHIGGKINVTFDSGCVMDFWRAPRRDPAKNGSVPGGSPVRPPDLYVRFKFARLRNSLLNELRQRKGLSVEFPGLKEPFTVRAYEVLTGERHAQFVEIRRAALKKGINVWHFEGAIKGRPKKGGKPVYLSKISDLDAILDDQD